MTDPSPSAANGADRSSSGETPIADITAGPAGVRPETANDQALFEAADAAVKRAMAIFDARAKTLTERGPGTSPKPRGEAEKRRTQGVEAAPSRPSAAGAASALAGSLIGHPSAASRIHVLALKAGR